jgi:lipopolysaccharide export system protein LptA
LLQLYSVALGQGSAPSGPVKVSASTMQYFGSENKSVFKGNVIAISDNYTLTANSVDIYFSSNNDVIKIIATGNVNFKTLDVLAVSNKAELDQEKKTVTLEGERVTVIFNPTDNSSIK